jgi:hypothetical protein
MRADKKPQKGHQLLFSSAGLASPWAAPVAESGTDFDPSALKARDLNFP